MTEGDSTAVFLAHFREQVPLYGEQVIVNLIDQKKAEGQLEVELRQLVREADIRGVHYVPFDFHRECKGMKYDRLFRLMDLLRPYQDEYEYYFLANHDGNTLKTQKGVFR